jgi:hypothetical protein
VNTFDSFGFIDGVGRGSDYTLPTFSGLNQTTGFGCQAIGDLDQEDTKSGTYQYRDTLTKVRGRHTMKFGGEFRNVYSNNYYDFYSRALFTFDINSQDGIPVLQNVLPTVDNTTIEDMTSALLGLVNTQSQTQFFTRGGARRANDEMDFRQREYAVFGQDEWKALPNLTLTYGLRWEYYAVPFEANGNLSNLFTDPSGPAPFTFTAVGPGTGHQLYQPYYRNFEPRVGFAWDPLKDGKTSIRGGIGVFSDRVYGNLINDVRGNPPFEPSVSNYLAYYSGPTSAAQLQYQIAPPQLTPSPVVADYNPNTGTGGLIFPDIFANNIKPPSVVTWNFGIQREIASHVTMEANYVGNHGTRVLRVVDGNAPQPGLVQGLVNYCSNPANATGCSISTLQFNSLYLGYEYAELPNDAVNNNAFVHTFTDQTSGRSFYSGLQAKVTARNFHGLQIQLAYTWSHALDDSSDPLSATLNNGSYPVDSFALNREYGNSGFDTRQRAVMNFVYQPDIGRGKSFLSHGVAGRVLEGWQISGIAAFQTGLPYDIFGPLDTLHTGIADRATVIDPSVLKTVPSTGKFFNGGAFTGFNPAAFNLEDGVSAPIPWGIPANVVRNQWYGPGVNNWDVSLAKTTALTERLKFQLRFETYNLFNRVQFAKPDNLTQYAGSYFGYSFSQTGQNDGTTGARQIQLGAKLTF